MDDIYEVVDRKLTYPKRSVLYGVKPISGTKDFTESINAYIVRLAMTHCVRPIDLIAQFLVSEIENSKWKTTNQKKAKAMLTNIAPVVLSPSTTAIKWSKCIEELTGINDLSQLSMQAWIGKISAYMLIRRKKQWCPDCYKEMNEDFGFVYDPLIWSLQIIETCPIHMTFLSNTCPECKKQQPLIPYKGRLNYCVFCGENLENSKTHMPKTPEALNYQNYLNTNLVDLIENGAIANECNQFSNNLSMLIENKFNGEISTFAKSVNFSNAAIYQWLDETSTPTIKSLIRLGYILDVKILDLLQKNFQTNTIKICPERIPYCKPPKRRKYSFNFDKTKKELNKYIKEENHPPLSLKKVSEKLGFDPSFLKKKFPEEVEIIKRNYRTYMQQKKEKAKIEAKEEINVCMKTLVKQGILPTDQEFRKRLSKPYLCFTERKYINTLRKKHGLPPYKEIKEY